MLPEVCICFIDTLLKYCCRCVHAASPRSTWSREPKSKHRQLWGSYSNHKRDRKRQEGWVFWISLSHKEAGCSLKPGNQMIEPVCQKLSTELISCAKKQKTRFIPPNILTTISRSHPHVCEKEGVVSWRRSTPAQSIIILPGFLNIGKPASAIAHCKRGNGLGGLMANLRSQPLLREGWWTCCTGLGQALVNRHMLMRLPRKSPAVNPLVHFDYKLRGGEKERIIFSKLMVVCGFMLWFVKTTTAELRSHFYGKTEEV